MYTMNTKRKGKRYIKTEGTAEQQGLLAENFDVSFRLSLQKLYITPAFRYERPQAGKTKTKF